MQTESFYLLFRFSYLFPNYEILNIARTNASLPINAWTSTEELQDLEVHYLFIQFGQANNHLKLSLIAVSTCFVYLLDRKRVLVLVEPLTYADGCGVGGLQFVLFFYLFTKIV